MAYLFVALLNFILRRMLSREDGVVVLCYHSVTSQQRSSFERQMHHISERSVDLDRIDEMVDCKSGVAVTFDDAFECLLDNVIPVTRDLQVPIAIFAVTGNFGQLPAWLAGSGHRDADLPTMTADQMRQLAGEPQCTIGSHTVSHRRLGDLPAAEVESELLASKNTIQGLLGVPCYYLALPHGSYRAEVIDLALRHGYRRVLTLDEIAYPSRWLPATVGRFSVSPDMWMIEFALTVRGAYSWLYPWRSWIRRRRQMFASVRHAG